MVAISGNNLSKDKKKNNVDIFEEKGISIETGVSPSDVFLGYVNGSIFSLAVVCLTGAILAASFKTPKLIFSALLIPTGTVALLSGKSLKKKENEYNIALIADESVKELGLSQGLNSIEVRQTIHQIVQTANELAPTLQQIRDSNIPLAYFAAIAEGQGLNGILKYEAMREANQQQISITQRTEEVAIPLSEKEESKPEDEINIPPNVASILRVARLPNISLDLEWFETLDAPNLTREVFNLNSGIDKRYKLSSELTLEFGQPCSIGIHAPRQIYVELSKASHDRIYPTMPTDFAWEQGGAICLLGVNTKGLVTVDLADERTPHILVGGTTGSGKTTSVLRPIIYSLLKQGNDVDVVGGKISDYEDLISEYGLRFHSNETAYLVAADFVRECDKRRNYSKEELQKEKRRVLIIDEYAGTVKATFSVGQQLLDDFIAEESDDNPGKPQTLVDLYDRNLSEASRLGRGVGCHVVIATQRVALRSNNDVDGLSSTVRGNLPCTIALSCRRKNEGNLLINGEGDRVLALQGRGDAILVGVSDERYQGFSV
jgi:hypothetical protein